MANDYGLKVSARGQDVLTAPAIDLRETTKYGRLKIFKMGTTPTIISGGNPLVIPHNLGYAPAFLVFYKSGSSFYPVFGGITESVFAYTDSTNLYIEFVDGYKSVIPSVTFRYYILLDPAQEFNSISNAVLTGNYGFKVSKPGNNVLDSPEYKMQESSKYKALQFFSESLKSESLTLPAMNASLYDPYVTSTTYVDFNHGLGYPPLFIGWFDQNDGNFRQLPFSSFGYIFGAEYDIFLTQAHFQDEGVVAFCDSTKIRVSFNRESLFDDYPDEWVPVPTHAAKTVNIRIVPFTENLNGYSWE